MRIAIASSGLGHVARGIETWALDTAVALGSRRSEVGPYFAQGFVGQGADIRGDTDGELAVTLFAAAPVAIEEVKLVVLPCLKRGGWLARLLARVGLPGAWRYGFGSPYQIEQETFFWSLVRALRSQVFDIVHLQDPWLAYRLEQARRKGWHRALVILAHGTEEPLDFLRRFDHVQELAPYYLGQDCRSGIGDKLWFAVPNFVNTQRFSPDVPPMSREELGVAEDAFMVLTVAAIKRTHKRVDVVIEAVKRLQQECPDRAVHLVVAGAREQETAEVMRFGKELLAGNITFLENFPRARMPELFRAADVMAHGALVEMMPIALLEASASGLPVVAHQWPVLAWIVGDGGTCVDATRAEHIASALSLYLSPGLRAERGRAARARAVSMFAEDVVVRQIVEMYAQVAGGKGGET